MTRSQTQGWADLIAGMPRGPAAGTGRTNPPAKPAKKPAQCLHPDDRAISFGGNPYGSLDGTGLPRTPANFRTSGRTRTATWRWCSACGAIGAKGTAKDDWMRPSGGNGRRT